MHAENILFEDVFQVDASTGRISLGSNRYVMFDTAAIGNMRHELMDNLGWEVTRGILERIGYRGGRRNARQLKRRYAWPSDEEWLRAGLRLHYLEGMAKVHLDRLEFDRSNGRLHVTGEWQDSFEAEQHLEQYGNGSRSVCWTLEGYASGYASEFYGEDVICLETDCRAKGDPSCKFELRPVAEWENEARPVQDMLTSVRFKERFVRCLRIISDMGCELEQTSLDAIITTDAHGLITSCSQGASEMLGIPPSEAIGKRIGAFYQGGHSEVKAIMERLKEARRIRNYLTELVGPDGRKTPIALSASAFRDRLR